MKPSAVLEISDKNTSGYGQVLAPGLGSKDAFVVPRIIRRWVFVVTFLVVPFCWTLTAQENLARLDQIDVLHYQFDLTLSEKTNEIQGEANIRLERLLDLPNLNLDLQAAEGGMGMTVRQVMHQGRPLRYQHQGQQLTIDWPEGTPVGKPLELRIQYAGTPADGLVIGQNKFGDRTFFGDNWPNRARHWLPTVDHPSDKATVEWVVTAPEGYQVVANGRQTEETNLDGDMIRHRFVTEVPLPTKVMVIGVAPFAVGYAGQTHGVPVSSWVFPQNREEGFYDYQPAVRVLDWFIEHVADYPFLKLANVQSKTRYGGMENAGNIFYFENSVNGRQEREALIAHEIAHQWFGNSASEKSWYHVWLSEGFATYFTHLYIEHTQGFDTFAERLQADRLRVLRFGRQRSAPIVDTTVTDFNQLLNPNSYQKGSWVLHMLRRKLGDDVFWAGIRTYYQRYKLRNALTEDFREVMEEVSGQDLKAFFHQWLHEPGYPDLAVTWTYHTADQEVEVVIRQGQDHLYDVPLTIQAVDSRLAPLGERTIRLDQREKTVRIGITEGKVETLALDPETNLLFTANIQQKQ